MVQIVDRPGLGQILGQQIGTGLGAGLSQLADLHLQNLLQQKQLQKGTEFWKGVGLDEQMARSFASAPEAIQKSILDRLEGLEVGAAMPGQPAELAGLQALQAPQEVRATEEVKAPGVEERITEEVRRPGLRLGASSAERRHRELLEEKKAARLSKEVAEQFKETKAERKEIIDKAKAARQNLNDLDRMSELLQSEKLDTPGFVEFARRSGMDIPSLMNPESQEFEKLSTNFLRDAKQYFGGRISNQEMTTFLKTLPTLVQSPEGMKRVLANLKRVNRVALEYNKERKKIMAKNKGVPPRDLLEQIDDKMENKLEKLTKQFKKDLKIPVPPAQNRWVTALQAGTGSLIGAAAPVLAKGGAGALLGLPFGPAGAAIGGGLGVSVGALQKLLGS